MGGLRAAIGDFFSHLLQSDSSTTTSSMASSDSPIQDPQSDTKTRQTLKNSEQTDTLLGKESIGGEEEDEDGECGFCLFMKGGGCKDAFVGWEKCVEEGEENNEDISDKCFLVTAALKKCMEAHSDYYAPILQAEKVAQEEALKELEKEKQRLNGQ